MKKIAAIQLVSGDNVQSNLDAAERLIKKAVSHGAKLVILPENFALFSTFRYQEVFKEQGLTEGIIYNFIKDASLRFGVWILAGTIPLPADKYQEESANIKLKRNAASLLFDDKGRCLGRYNKIHLFDVKVNDHQGVYNESDYIEPGDKIVVINTPVGKLGISVCYDLRFPELYIELAAKGAEIIAVPSAFTKVTGEAHWEVLLRARAIETQCYIVAANQGGLHPSGRETFGHSMIVSPWGEVLDQCEQGEGIVYTDIDLSALKSIRERMPIDQHRRL